MGDGGLTGIVGGAIGGKLLDKALGKGTDKLFEKAEKSGWLDNLVDVFRRKHKILVLGLTGTGKTNFLISLTETTPQAINLMSRTRFMQKHKIRIQKNPFVFVDTPGEKGKEDERRKAIKEAMRDGVKGVINVVSFGYHEARQHEKKNVFNRDGSVKEKFLKDRRREEIDFLQEWTPLLGDADISGWLITLVTKADLWWGQREEVLKHYSSGQYFNKLGDGKNLSPMVLEYCSVIHKFYNQGKLSGDFDDADRTQTKSNLLLTLMEAIGKGTLGK